MVRSAKNSVLVTLGALFFLLYLPGASATDFDRPLQSGVAAVRIQAASPSSAGLTRSVGLRREDTLDLVFCAPLEPGAELIGESTPIVNLGGEVLLHAIAFDAHACTGLESLPSADRYRVVFGAPGKPMLLEALPTP